ncbi:MULTISPECIES: hypothetical protein [unclassified Clostridium]|uniref:hypothetical protein n=1 Tax=unclassified Clostridium TaxID=2614128 RepID=UPI0002973007|nr:MULTISPECIES: hypothetical protein [unclassified Clostridium]EKQ51303.1 MAG: putative integral membrane protein [Clostridium sp. Maddingley MBC34-26]
MKNKEYLNIMDNKIRYFIYDYAYLLFILLISICALIIRFDWWFLESHDYTKYLLPWCQYLENNGGFLGLSSLQSDYNVSYLYILAAFTYLPLSYLSKIKIVSIIFDFACAIASSLLIKHFTNNKNSKLISTITYSLVLFVPTVIANSSAWGQCDSIYVSFILFSLYFLLDENYKLSFLFYGISFAFKLQAIFILPLFIILYFNKKDFSIVNFLIVPIINFLIYIPAWLLGRPLNLLWNIYFIQTNEYKAAVLNFPNIYNFLPSNINIFNFSGLIFTISILGILLMFILFGKSKLTNLEIIKLALLLNLLTTYFLPSIHDRYTYLADILAVIYCIIKKEKFMVTLGLILISLNSYIFSLLGIIAIPMKIAASIQLILVYMILVDFIKPFNSANEIENSINNCTNSNVKIPI